MITYNILPGTVDVSVTIRIIDSTDGTPETGVVFNTSGIDLQYRREGAASTAITEATLAALTTAHSDGGFLHIGNGYYRLDLPDAACATGAPGVLVHGTVTGMVVIGCYIQLEGFVNSVYTRIGAPAGASVSADIAVIEAQTDDIGAAGAGLTALASQASVNTIDDFLDTEIAAILAAVDTEVAAIKTDTAAILVDTAEIGAAGAGLTAINLPDQTMNIVGNITGNLSGSVGSVTGAVGSVTGAVGSVTGLTASDVAAIKAKTDSLAFTVAGQVDANMQYINDTALLGNGGVTPWGPA